MHSVTKAAVAAGLLAIALAGCQSSPNIKIEADNGAVINVTNGSGEQERGRQGVPVTNTGGIAGGTGGGSVTPPLPSLSN